MDCIVRGERMQKEKEEGAKGDHNRHFMTILVIPYP